MLRQLLFLALVLAGLAGAAVFLMAGQSHRPTAVGVSLPPTPPVIDLLRSQPTCPDLPPGFVIPTPRIPSFDDGILAPTPRNRAIDDAILVPTRDADRYAKRVVPERFDPCK